MSVSLPGRVDVAVEHLDERVAGLLAGLAHQQHRVQRLAAGRVVGSAALICLKKVGVDDAADVEHDDHVPVGLADAAAMSSFSVSVSR